MNEKKQSLSDASDSRISDSITSKESKANIYETSGNRCENTMGIQFKQTDLTRQESHGNKHLIPMKSHHENVISPFDQSPMLSGDVGLGA